MFIRDSDIVFKEGHCLNMKLGDNMITIQSAVGNNPKVIIDVPLFRGHEKTLIWVKLLDAIRYLQTTLNNESAITLLLNILSFTGLLRT